MKRLLLVVGLLSLGAPGFSVAQGISLKPDEIIAARQSGMALTGGIAAALKAAVASGEDPKVYVDSAAGLVKWGKAYPVLFPEGTETGLNTKAKKEIWSDRAGFEKASAAMVGAAEKLGDAAKAGDKAAFAAAFQTLGQSCGGCHRNYRER